MNLRTLFDDILYFFDDSRIKFDSTYDVVGDVVLGGGGQKREKKPRYLRKFVLSYRVRATKTFLKYFEYQTIGTLKTVILESINVLATIRNTFTEVQNFIGTIKNSLQALTSVLGTSKNMYITSNYIEGTRIEKFLSDEIITGNRKEIYSQFITTESKLNCSIHNSFRIHRKIELNKSSSVKGNFKICEESNVQIIGKKDISNILEALDILD